MSYTYKEIPDVEVHVASVTSSNSPTTIGLSKTKEKVMLTLKHHHSIDSPMPGMVYCFMSRTTAVDIIKQLTVLTSQL